MTVLLAIALAALVSCGAPAQPTRPPSAHQPSNPTASAQPPSEQPPPPSESPSVPPPVTSGPSAGPPSAGPGEAVLTGVLEMGTEPGCRILNAGARGHYEITGAAAGKLRAGDHVQVRGHVLRAVRSHCQQGPIFTVTSATVAQR